MFKTKRILQQEIATLQGELLRVRSENQLLRKEAHKSFKLRDMADYIESVIVGAQSFGLTNDNTALSFRLPNYPFKIVVSKVMIQDLMGQGLQGRFTLSDIVKQYTDLADKNYKLYGHILKENRTRSLQRPVLRTTCALTGRNIEEIYW